MPVISNDSWYIFENVDYHFLNFYYGRYHMVDNFRGGLIFAIFVGQHQIAKF